MMALSKQEQDVLDEIEQSLREDPAFATGLDPQRVRRRGRLLAVGLVVVGLLLLVTGEVQAMTVVAVGVIVAVCGFLLMLAGCAPSVRGNGLRAQACRSGTVPAGPSAG